MTFIPISEVRCGVFRPHIGFCQQYGTRILFIHVPPDLFQECMRLGQVFTVRSFPFKKVRYRVKPETVNAHITPIVEDFKDLFLYLWAVVIEIWLMMKKTVPVVLLRYRVP